MLPRGWLRENPPVAMSPIAEASEQASPISRRQSLDVPQDGPRPRLDNPSPLRPVSESVDESRLFDTLNAPPNLPRPLSFTLSEIDGTKSDNTHQAESEPANLPRIPEPSRLPEPLFRIQPNEEAYRYPPLPSSPPRPSVSSLRPEAVPFLSQEQTLEGKSGQIRDQIDRKNEGTVKRSLQARHVQMIAIGGTLGTGLFLGSGAAYAMSGPLGILLSYGIMGLIVITIMLALGEMCALYPVSGAFTHFVSRFCDPALGFAVGWNYWYMYTVALPTDIGAAVVLIQWWPGGSSITGAVWVSVMLSSIVCFNTLGVTYYGEIEFWFVVVKVLTIFGILIVSLCVTAGAGSSNEPIGFRYWSQPFQQLFGIPGSWSRFLAFWSTFTKSAFSYLGTEIVALTAAETRNPRRNIPTAARKVFSRIICIYVACVFMIGLIVSPNNPYLTQGKGAAGSPWVIAVRGAGLKAIPSIINGIIISSTFSAGNSHLYAASRTLYGLALDGKAPQILRQCNKRGLPIYCIMVNACFGMLSYMTLGTGATAVFTWLANLASISGLVTWACILLAYIRFHHGAKSQGVSRDDFPYKAPYQPYISYVGLGFILLVILTNGFTVFFPGRWSTSDFIVAYFTLPMFAFLFIFWKRVKHTRWVRAFEMDFESGRRELDAMHDHEEREWEEPAGWKKIWTWL